MAIRTFGVYFKECRIAAGKTLRAFCEENGWDPGNISKLERGLLGAPESDDKLEEYAKALGLKRGATEWQEFFDLAAIERGRIPTDLQDDEELLGRLPVLFRTLRGKRIDPKQLDALIERIRKA